MQRRANKCREGTVQITPEKQQLIGVEYGTAEYETVTSSVRAVARVTLDETKIAKVHSKLEGWIDQVFVDFTGKQVQKGDPLLTIYSPEALATQQEYLLAIKAQHMMHDEPGARDDGQHGEPGGRGQEALELWDITRPPDRRDAAHGQDPEEPDAGLRRSPGFVMERNAFPKQRITPETALYTIADLSTVWVIARCVRI